MSIDEVFYVKYKGMKDRLLWVDIGGTTYVYERDPQSEWTLKQIDQKFKKLLTFSQGKALAWLKQHTIMRHKMKEAHVGPRPMLAEQLIDQYLEAEDEPGKRDGSGPYSGGVGRRQANGETCPSKRKKKVELTRGMANALKKQESRVTCECGFSVPRYEGRYPNRCPQCGEALNYECKDK